MEPGRDGSRRTGEIVSAEELERLAAEQRELAVRVVIPADGGYVPRTGDVVLALDIQYEGDDAHVAGDLHRYGGGPLGTFAGVARVNMPYVSSYFCFREGPPLLSLIRRLEQESLPAPDVIVVDGHGIAHPRRFGVGCWLGVATGKPVMGCAKETLLPYCGDLGETRGSVVDVALEGETVGYVLRRQDRVNPVFLSPGHLVSLKTCIDIALGLPGTYRIPDPLRNADHAARAHCKGEAEPGWKDLGKLEATQKRLISVNR